MSLFDVLKYPISDIPTQSELAALPKDLYDKWIRRYSQYKLDSPLTLAMHYKVMNKFDLDCIEEIKTLRKMIKNYEPV